MKIFFDGGARPNPGKLEIGVVAGGDFFHEKNIGHGSNNRAEWLALLYALSIAEHLGVKNPDIYGDSMLVVNQANGTWKCKSDELKPFLEEFNVQKNAFSNMSIRHVRRAHNLAGIALEKGTF